MTGSVTGAIDAAGAATGMATHGRRHGVRSDTELVVAARADEPDAFGPLAHRWFDRCWEVAWRILRDRDLAADVAQDTMLTAWRQLDRLHDPDAFGGWVLRIARNRALDRLARERRTRPTADDEDLEQPVRGHDPAGPEAVVARRQEHDLVWAAAAALGERDASLLDLHLRHGLEPGEIADELDIAPNAAHQAMFRLRKRLGESVQAWLLWREGTPACVVLRAELAAAGRRTFDAATAKAITRHARSCGECGAERERVVAPAALFSAVPLIAAPDAVRAHAMELLSQAGVPVASPTGGDAAGPWDGGSAEGDARDGVSHGDGFDGRGADGDADDGMSGGDGADGGGADGDADHGVSHGDGADGDGAGRDAGDVLGVRSDGDAPPAATDVVTNGVATPGAGGRRPPEALPDLGGLRRRRPRARLPVAAAVVAVVVVIVGGLGAWLRAGASQPSDAVDDEPAVEIVEPPEVPAPPEEQAPLAADPVDQDDDQPDDAPPVPPDPVPAPPVVPPDPAPGPPAVGDPPAPEPPAADPPRIAEFVARAAGACQSSRTVVFALSWRSQFASTATLTDPAGVTEQVQPSGSVQRCAASGGTFTLRVAGPGGEAAQSVQALVPEADPPDPVTPEVVDPELVLPDPIDPEPVLPGGLLVPDTVAPEPDADQPDPIR